VQDGVETAPPSVGARLVHHNRMLCQGELLCSSNDVENRFGEALSINEGDVVP
tara:strand:+ start:565 stop:723 length:159 start_codon:yes stop_codon:yes gene_type:complete